MKDPFQNLPGRMIRLQTAVAIMICASIVTYFLTLRYSSSNLQPSTTPQFESSTAFESEKFAEDTIHNPPPKKSGPGSKPYQDILPEDILESLRDSFMNDPAPADEKWAIGPAEDIKDEDTVVHREDLDPDVLRPIKKFTTTVRRTRVVKMTLNANIDIDEAFRRWQDRLYGEIETSEIEVAKLALRSAQILSFANRRQLQTADSHGARFTTRAGIMGSRRVELTLLWIDPNEPQARKAWEKFKQGPH